MLKYLWIAIGGACGSIARYWVSTTIGNRIGSKFPYGTFVVNITACLLIGFAIAFLVRRTSVNPAMSFLIPIGFIGAYSTFSTFEWETFARLQSGDFALAGLYVVASFLLGLGAIWCGVFIADLI